VKLRLLALLMMCRVPGLRGVAENIPFLPGKGPFRLTGDLFNRFSAPVEYRYSRREGAAPLSDAGLRVTRIGNERGWMGLGEAL
jgi:hypothetical protein